MVRISRARLDMEDGRIDQAVLKDYGETLVGGASGAEIGSTYYIDLHGCPVDGGLYFQSSSSQDVNTGSGIDVSNSSCSISLWARRTVASGSGNYIVSQGTASTNLGLHFGFRNATTFTFAFWANDLDTAANNTDTDWHHWVGTYDAATNERILYKDNAVAASDTASADYQGSGTLYIGSRFNSGLFFDGFIDDVRVYNDVLTSDEVATLYNKGSVTSGLLGHWKFDETKGTSASDASGNGNTGTLSNGPIWTSSGGNVFHLILTTNFTPTFPSGLPVGATHSFTLLLKQDSAGGRTVTWPANVSWVAGAAPTLTLFPYRYDILTFTTYDGGTRWYGFVGGQAYVESGGLWSWGSGGSGRTGLNSTATISSPAQVGALTNWVRVSAGSYHGLAVKGDGTLWSWGSGTYGQTGRNATSTVSSPVQLGALTTWAKVAAGSFHSLAIKTDNTLWMWGAGLAGKLGQNSTANISSPAQVGALTNWAQAACGYANTFAVKTDGTLWAWGQGTNGKLGTNATATVSSPTQIGALTNWKQVFPGGEFTLAVKTDGTLWAWGQGTNGVTGFNSTATISSPAQVGALTDWKQVSAAASHAAAIKTDGTLWVWGLGTSGRLGLNSTASVSSPTQVGSLTDWKQVSAGYVQTVALKTDGTVWAWGLGTNGRLGLNSAATVSSPTQIGSLNNWVQIDTWFTHTHGIKRS